MIVFLERYSFLLILLFCLGLMSPDLSPKIGMLEKDIDMRIEGKSGGSVLKQLFWIGLFLFFLFKHCLNTAVVFESRKLAIAMLLLLTVCFFFMISASWASYPMFSIKRSFFQFIFVFTLMSSILYCHRHSMIEKNVKYAMYGTFSMILFSVVSGAAFQPDGAMAGFSEGKNVFGINILCLLLIFILINMGRNVKFKNIVYCIAASLLFLFLSLSKTSLMILFMFIALCLMSGLVQRLIISTIFVSFVSFFIVYPSYMHYFDSMDVLFSTIDDDTLTGRGFIWNTLYYDLDFFNKFIFGYGYGSYFGVPEIPYFFDDSHSFIKFITSTHNGYIDLMLQVGTLISLFIMCLFFKAASYINDKYFFAALILPVVHNFTESSVARDDSMVWLFLIFIISYSCINGDSNAKNRLAGQ